MTDDIAVIYINIDIAIHIKMTQNLVQNETQNRPKMGPKWGPNGVQNDTYLKIASRVARNRLRGPSGTPPERKNTIFMSQISILNRSYIVWDPPDRPISPKKASQGALKRLPRWPQKPSQVEEGEK